MTKHPGAFDLDQCLTWRAGQISLNIPDQVLPAFLIEAYNHTCAGNLAEARDRLSADNLQCIEQLAHQQRQGIALVFLVMGMVYQRLGLLKTASQWYERTLALQTHALVQAELAGLYEKRLLYGAALNALERALALLPTAAHLAERYPDYLVMAGRIREAVIHLQNRVETDTISPHAHSSLLVYLHYLPEISATELRAAHRLWGQKHAPPRRTRTCSARDLDPDRRLRIGFLSADFRQHSVAYTFEALLDGRDRPRMELWGYGSVARPDQVTERLKAKFDHYRPVFGLDDRAVAELIGKDQIDILVALAGHTSGHRLRVLGYQPAPVQVDWGSLATLGMEQVKYHLTDRWLDPPETQENYLEAFVYLPGGFVCYRPAQDMPPVGPAPVLQNGHITFGSFNSLLKINEDTLTLWTEVLKAVPGSRLLLKFPGSHDPILASELAERFQGKGIGPDRLCIAGYCRSFADHIQYYQAVDIALDTCHFNGCVTTLEALWMGVPLINPVGDRYTGRTGLSLLTQLGLDFFCARTPKEYVKKAMALASQVPSLVQLRSTLRQRMLGSSLCDSQRYARELETAFRAIWRCHSQTESAGRVLRSPLCARFYRKTPSLARERDISSSGNDGEAGDIGFIVDTAGSS